ncbi:dihydroneopterin triphosphate diphosphatase [Chitinimonas lacunae]|uniref:Dihydroneopterin triphosphate diphosphatase n=1 Tax=Chitinimonas lacunae TaxID=1963018 RepID=A0ABV8MPQ1_9NEIS
MSAYKQPVSVLVVIYTPQLETLILERTDFKDAWQSVTGSIEPGETLRNAAIREVKEETGIDASLYQLQDWDLVNTWEIYEIWRHRYAPGVTENTEHVFGLLLPERVEPLLSEREHSHWLWREYGAAAEQVFSPSNAEALRLLPEIARRFGVDQPIAGHA